MCGIVGAAGDLTHLEEKMFRFMLMHDTYRGPHSTGVFSAHKFMDKYHLVKEVGTPYDGFFKLKETEEMFRSVNRLLIGHNRAATKGAITRENAHPFEHGNIVGVHNGTIRRQSLYKDSNKFDVDSDNLYYNISEEGLEETLKKTDGAFALVFFDKEKQELNFVRNDERPLFYALSTTGKCLFWASEPWMIQVAAAQAKVNIGDVLSFKELAWYRLPLPALKAGSQDSILGKFIVRSVKEYEAPVNYYSYNNNNYGRYNGFRQQPLPAPPQNKVIPFRNAVEESKPKVDDSTKPRVFTANDYDHCVNKLLHFRIVTANKANKYIELVTTALNTGVRANIPARLYPPSDSSIIWSCVDIGDVFMARVKKVTRNGVVYLLLDHQSLNQSKVKKKAQTISKAILSKVVSIVTPQPEVEVVDSDVPEDMVNVEGSEIPVREFQRLVKDGCSYCCQVLQVEDASEILWVKGSPFCSNKECKEAANHYAGGETFFH